MLEARHDDADHGLGLRTQIVVSLSAAFIASFTLLGIATALLTQHARTSDRLEAARLTAIAVARSLELDGADAQHFVALTRGLVGRHGVRGVEVVGPRGSRVMHGSPHLGQAVEAPIADGETLRLWLSPPDPRSGAQLANLLVLYVAMTAGGILVLAYVSLTYLIVRPLEAVTRASERLAAGVSDVTVPVRGAAEVARLAVAFNAMASELRDERRALESKLAENERTTQELRTAQDQVVAGARLAAVGRLAAGVAHEIGNPLAAILGLLELVRGGDLDATESAEFLRRIQSETERIHSIIRGLLDFSRRGGEDGATGGAHTDVVAVIADTVRLLAPQEDLRDVAIETRFEPELPPVRCARDALAQVVLNLVLNAADAVAGAGHICIEAARDGDTVRLAVVDDGPGIDASVRDHLFEPFVTTKPVGRGTGLGLAVCATLVERAGGSIAAFDVPAGGARFEVILPAAGVAS